VLVDTRHLLDSICGRAHHFSSTSDWSKVNMEEDEQEVRGINVPCMVNTMALKPGDQLWKYLGPATRTSIVARKKAKVAPKKK
jgi:hypothetical protein